MNRLYEAPAYAPETGRFWVTSTAPPWPELREDLTIDTAIIGGGFTGLNAALTLAQSGARIAVFEAMNPGWGASGRNGGFCCLGGSMLTPAQIEKRFGSEAAEDWVATEIAAVQHVQDLLKAHHIVADTHSQGETCLAHSARAWQNMLRDIETEAARYGFTPEIHEASELPRKGMAGPWHGGITRPVGFALNPQKYHSGLAKAAQEAGALLYQNTPICALHREGGHWRLGTSTHHIRANQVIIATNGYSADDLPGWLRARYLPVQSHVIVTRPLSVKEQQAAGWWSDQMAYDSRALLHYFRLMPDGRFLFGMRGGLQATPRAQAASARKIRADFQRMFPAWASVEITHDWNGLVCLMADLLPFVGPVPDQPGLYAALGFHGNGVAMGSYAGALLAKQMTTSAPLPEVMTTPPGRFPLGRFRRNLLRPAYVLSELFDL